MNKFGEIIAVILVVLTIGGTIWAIFFYEAKLAKERNAITLEAIPIATWSKKEIRVKKGKLVKIKIINKDCVTHGFEIPELDTGEIIIRAGELKIVEFIPEYTGEYIYKCTVQCDREKHELMTGKLIVEE